MWSGQIPPNTSHSANCAKPIHNGMLAIKEEENKLLLNVYKQPSRKLTCLIENKCNKIQ